MKTRKNKRKKFFIYLFPNICLVATIIYLLILMFEMYYSKDISLYLAFALILVLGIVVHLSLYNLFFVIETKFWDVKEQLAYKRLRKILEIREYKNSDEYNEKISFENKFNEKFKKNNQYDLCYKIFLEETKNESYFNKEYYLRELSGKETPEEIVTIIRNRKSLKKIENNNRSGFGAGFLLGRWIK